MAKLSKFQQDVTKSEEGTQIDLGDGLIVTVCRIGCKSYNDSIKKQTAPYQRQIRNKTLDDFVFENIMNKAFADTILIDWKGMEDDDGKEIVYSKEKCFEILSNPAYKDLKDTISDLANEAEAFRVAEVTETATKSS